MNTNYQSLETLFEIRLEYKDSTSPVSFHHHYRVYARQEAG